MTDLPATATALERELTTILEGIGEGFYCVDRNWRVVRYNSAAAQHFGRAAESVLGRVLWDVFPSANGSELSHLFKQVMTGRRAMTGETASILAPGHWVAYRVFPLGDGIAVVFSDISQRKQAEQHRELLIGELHHRVKNTLATVQGIARFTLRGAGIAPAVQRDLDSRLVALGAAHNVLAEWQWQSADLHDVVWTALRPHVAADRERFTMDGPALRLKPTVAVTLSMALHEMCTNAIKHGALSAEGGSVAVAWTIADGRFRLIWREQGGPPVAAPTRRGFGLWMIERGLANDLGATVSIDYRPEGVVCTLDAPLATLQEAPEPD